MKMLKRLNPVCILIIVFLLGSILPGCSEQAREYVDPHSAIPTGNQKFTPDDDLYPPILHSDEFQEPVPLPYPVNSAGGEDSPYVPCCNSNAMYMFFTPDVQVPQEAQAQDDVTGIYYTRHAEDGWEMPRRVWLQDVGKLSLDGCPFANEDTLWFCTAREGLTGLHWFKAEIARNDTVQWKNWELVDFPASYEVGELHISQDGSQLFFHSTRPGGLGGLDLWVSRKIGGIWTEPENLSKLNSPADEGWPALSQDEAELWFTRWHEGTSALFRSHKIDGHWEKPELIISQFAGEPTLDADGNVYFTHHFYQDGEMYEADIYVAMRK